MKNMIIIAVLLFLFTSCKNKEKFEFIKNFVEHQENLVELFNAAPFVTTEFSKRLKDSSWVRIYREWSEKFLIKNEDNGKEYYFEVIYYKENLLRFSDGTKKPLVRIIIKSKNNFKLEFNWIMYENDTWVLNSIKRALNLEESHDKPPEN
jgi:hypothetical protein